MEWGSFAYAADYLSAANAHPLSVSLPLREELYSPFEAKPYFEGLVPEGEARRLVAAELRVREDDYLAMLSCCGLDCVGDLVITAGPFPLPPRYEPIDKGTLETLFARKANMANCGSWPNLFVSTILWETATVT